PIYCTRINEIEHRERLHRQSAARHRHPFDRSSDRDDTGPPSHPRLGLLSGSDTTPSRRPGGLLVGCCFFASSCSPVSGTPMPPGRCGWPVWGASVGQLSGWLPNGVDNSGSGVVVVAFFVMTLLPLRREGD